MLCGGGFAEIDANTQGEKISRLLQALATGNTFGYLNVALNEINEAEAQVDGLRTVIINGKKMSDYDYYQPILDSFSKIYTRISAYEIMPLLGFSTDEVANLDKIEALPLEERKVEIQKVLSKLNLDQSQVDFSKPPNVIDQFLLQLRANLLSNKAVLSKLSGEIYFVEIDDIIKGIDNYVKLSTKTIEDGDVNRLVIEALYMKTYELNKKILIDAYEKVHHARIDISENDAFTKVRTWIRETYSELDKAMENDPRVGFAHGKYKKLEKYASQELSDMSVRNFITAVVGIVAKTDSIANTFGQDIGKVENFANSSIDLSQFFKPVSK